MYQDTCVVQGKEYEAVPTEHNTASCDGCAFLESAKNCADAMYCDNARREDKHHVIWVLKENN